jgi:hypothetical protein
LISPLVALQNVLQFGRIGELVAVVYQGVIEGCVE